MYNERLESLIEAALADGELTEKEKQVLYKNAQALGVDLDEFEMVLDAKLYEKQKAMKKEAEEKIQAETSAPKSNKYGDVRKCPQCGAVVQAMVAICPECGHEFVGVAANSSSQKLAALLQKVDEDLKNTHYTVSWNEKMAGMTEDEHRKIDSYSKKADVVSSFPIPNTKEDLMEFAITMKTGINTYKNKTTGRGPFYDKQIRILTDAYSSKYEECISKMNIMFPNDPLFQSLLADHKKMDDKKKKGFFGKLFGK